MGEWVRIITQRTTEKAQRDTEKIGIEELSTNCTKGRIGFAGGAEDWGYGVMNKVIRLRVFGLGFLLRFKK
jgi:hypothetical protein